MNGRRLAETFTITLGAVLASLVLFGAFMYVYTLLFGAKTVLPQDLYYWTYRGAFGSKTSWMDTLTRAAPLILAALCTALPARLGLIVIGGEGALVLGALASVAAGLALGTAPAPVIWAGMALAGMATGGLFIGLVGLLRDRRGVNETISSLLLTYIAIAVFNFAVEGPMRDPASLNKPSTYPIAEAAWIGTIPGYDVHWGLVLGVLLCLVFYVLMDHTTFGFAARMVGGNVKAAQVAGLPVTGIILATCVFAGASAGLAGMVEVGAVHHQANATLVAGYGFQGILVAFIARHQPIAIPPVAVLFGGLGAASGVLQRRLDLPDASMQVFTGMLFVLILLFETFYGRMRIFQSKAVRAAAREQAVPPPAPQVPEVATP